MPGSQSWANRCKTKPALPDMIRCAVGKEWREPSEFSKRQLGEFQARLGQGDTTAAKSGISCRVHTPGALNELQCQGPCGKIQSIHNFSKHAIRVGRNWCGQCIDWQLANEPNIASYAAPENELGERERDRITTLGRKMTSDMIFDGETNPSAKTIQTVLKSGPPLGQHSQATSTAHTNVVSQQPSVSHDTNSYRSNAGSARVAALTETNLASVTQAPSRTGTATPGSASWVTMSQSDTGGSAAASAWELPGRPAWMTTDASNSKNMHPKYVRAAIMEDQEDTRTIIYEELPRCRPVVGLHEPACNLRRRSDIQPVTTFNAYDLSGNVHQMERASTEVSDAASVISNFIASSTTTAYTSKTSKEKKVWARPASRRIAATMPEYLQGLGTQLARGEQEAPGARTSARARARATEERASQSSEDEC